MADPYDTQHPGLTSPAISGFDITPDDDTDMATLPRAIFVGSAGDVAVQWADGGSSVLANVPAGQVLSIRPARVLATGTTATALVGLY